MRCPMSRPDRGNRAGAAATSGTSFRPKTNGPRVGLRGRPHATFPCPLRPRRPVLIAYCASGPGSVRRLLSAGPQVSLAVGLRHFGGGGPWSSGPGARFSRGGATALTPTAARRQRRRPPGCSTSDSDVTTTTERFGPNVGATNRTPPFAWTRARRQGLARRCQPQVGTTGEGPIVGASLRCRDGKCGVSRGC